MLKPRARLITSSWPRRDKAGDRFISRGAAARILKYWHAGQRPEGCEVLIFERMGPGEYWVTAELKDGTRTSATLTIERARRH